MPSRFDPPPAPNPPESDDASIDTSKRYDVYCSVWQAHVVVYRNVLFKRERRLFCGGEFDVLGRFIELEQANGQSIFINFHGIIRFCEPGTELLVENISLK